MQEIRNRRSEYVLAQECLCSAVKPYHGKVQAILKAIIRNRLQALRQLYRRKALATLKGPLAHSGKSGTGKIQIRQTAALAEGLDSNDGQALLLMVAHNHRGQGTAAIEAVPADSGQRAVHNDRL